MNIWNTIEEEVKKHRRALHLIPELGFEEFKTQKYLKDALSEYGYEPIEICATGVYVFIEGNSDETIAFRSDIDALSIKEENSVDFKSSHDGKMHACGHDGHMATLLGFAKYLTTVENLEKNVLLVFQPAEEGPGGAKNIVESGILKEKNVKGIFGLHLFPSMPEGTVGTKAGPMMAQTAEVDIDIVGKSGHGAMPHKGIDSVLITAQLLQAYQSIISRNISPMENCVLTFGKIEGGSARNIVAESVRIEGTFRAFKKDVFQIICDRITEINKGFELTYDVKINTDIRPLYPPVINDSALFEGFKNAVEKVDIEFQEIEAVMLAEDFSFYQEAIDGLFFFLGTGSEEKGFTAPLHNCRFNFDEKMLVNGVKIYSELAKEFKCFK